jgi:hypothetical protein
MVIEMAFALADRSLGISSALDYTNRLLEDG